MEIFNIIGKYEFTKKYSTIIANSYRKIFSKVNPATRARFTSAISKFCNNINEGSALFSIIAVVVSVILMICSLFWFESLREGFYQGVFVEFSGMIFDLIVFGILLAIYTKYQEKKTYIQNQEDLIDDYMRWNTVEGKLRIAGALRRIQKTGKHNHDFGGINLTDFSFKSEGILNLSGSSFVNDFFSLKKNRPESFNTTLKNVSFSFTICNDVDFSVRNFSSTRLEDCDFVDCNLTNSSFNNAILKYNIDFLVLKESDWHEDMTGEGHFAQVHYPPFWQADLTGVSFQNVTLENVDFRGVFSIENANFNSCVGLETCIFDKGVDIESIKKRSQK